ncbi:MAG: glycine cleavage system transcriptional repressor [Gammaproteobacteria bacterium]|jgi:glycine cleavage system transcriptional repressor
MLQQLVLVAMGKHSPRLIEELTKAILDCSCSISDSRMSNLGSECALVVKISGTWDAIAKFEDSTPKLATRLGLSINSNRIHALKSTSGLMPYAIDAVCSDRLGVVHEIARFMADNDLQIQDLYTNTYQAANTGTQMFSVHMTINIPADASISLVRNDFMDLCDRLNLDAIMEPVK